MKKAIVTQVPEREVPTEILATAITEISQGLRKLRSGRLNDRALMLLIQHASGVSQRDIRTVLDSISSLETTYLRKKP